MPGRRYIPRALWQYAKADVEATMRLHKALNPMRCGLLIRWYSAWVGVHYSPYNRRFCINLVPFVTFWFTLPGGKVPERSEK